MDYYSAKKRNELLIQTSTWIDLKGIMLRKKNPIAKSYILYDSISITVLK